jgi:hypothetical protein
MTTTKRSSFRGKVNVDAKKEPKTTGKSYLNLPEGIKQYNAKEGLKKILLDFLPYIITDPKHPNRDEKNGIAIEGDYWYRRPFKIHRNVGVDKDTVICPKSVGKPCPICAYQKKRYDEGAKVEEVKDLYPSDRDLYVVVPLEQDDFDEIPYVWDMSERLFQDTLKDKIDEDPDKFEVFPALDEGLTLEVSLKWKTLGKSTFPEATYIEMFKRKPYKESIMDEIPSLDEVLDILPFDELKAKFFEIIDEEDGGKLKPVDEDDDDPREERRERKALRRETEPEERPTRREREREPERSTERRRPERTSEPEPEKTERRRVSRDEADVVDRRPERTSSRDEVKSGDNKGKDRCPYGHKFGVDTEKFTDCDECKLFDDCLDAKDAK